MVLLIIKTARTFLIEKLQGALIMLPHKWRSFKKFSLWFGACLVGWMLILIRFVEIKEFFERRKR